jgi:hypothetical protein
VPASETSSAAVEAEYASRLASRQRTLAVKERQQNRVSSIRFGLLAAAILLMFTMRIDALPWLALVGLVFLVAVIVHIRLFDARDRARRAVVWYQHGLARLDHGWPGLGDPGDRFRQADHLYADDLDLFGRGSMFDLLSTPCTRAGQEVLAAWLLAPAPLETIAARQSAVRELAGRPDLREAMAVVGEGVRVDAEVLRRWATAPADLPTRWWTLVLALVSIVNVTLLVRFLVWNLDGELSLAVMILQGLVVLAFRSRVIRVIHTVDAPARDLTVLTELLRLLEREQFETPVLQQLSRDISAHQSDAASGAIAHLDRLASGLASRRNMFIAVPAALAMWATQFAFSIDGWRRRHGRHVPGWLAAVGEFEALASLSTFAAEHPAYVFPVFDTGPARVDGTSVAHPLLPKSAVANDVSLGGHGPAFIVVSGSNMSGKSTFLRALGVNVVLAHAGAPVRASTFVLTPLAIGTSIRVLDSLQDGQSRFFAEITRLKAIVDLTRRHPSSTLFLLDEILSGTNSHDRTHGAEGLLRGLIAAGAIGLVTTHDLALTAVGDASGNRAANAHFADEFDAGGLSFDYRLRPGPVRTSNALALMHSIGLDV